MIEFRKFVLSKFRLYMNDKYGDADRVPIKKYEEEFKEWYEKNEEELLSEFERYENEFIYRG